MYRWIKDYYPIVSKHLIYSPAEFYDISRKRTKTKHQLEIIKLSQCMDEIPLTKRLGMLDGFAWARKTIQHTRDLRCEQNPCCSGGKRNPYQFQQNPKDHAGTWTEKYSLQCEARIQATPAVLKAQSTQPWFYSRVPELDMVSEITYFKITDRSIYLCVIINLFSRRIVGFHAI